MREPDKMPKWMRQRKYTEIQRQRRKERNKVNFANKSPAARAEIQRIKSERLLHRAQEINFLRSARSRQKLRGEVCNLTVDDLIVPEFCPVFGIKLERRNEKGRCFKSNMPSMDRVDPSKGYIKGNVQIISWRANRLKSDLTLTEVKSLYKYMELNTPV